RRLRTEVIPVREELDDRGRAYAVLGSELPFAKFLAVEINDDARAAEIELDHLEVGADIGLDALLGEIDEVRISAVVTARLLPHHRKLLARCGGALKIVGKLKYAIEKPILPVEPIVGHDRRGPGRAGGQRKTATPQHQGAS